MKNGIRGFLVIASASLLLAACAAQQSAPAARTAPVKGDAAISAGNTVPTTGYRKIKKNGVDYYCSRETLTGSRTDSQVRCLTEAQLTAVREGAQDMLRRQQGHVGEQSSSANPGGAPYSAVQPLP
jgi:uncharacterized lipoprotein YajG